MTVAVLCVGSAFPTLEKSRVRNQKCGSMVFLYQDSTGIYPHYSCVCLCSNTTVMYSTLAGSIIQSRVSFMSSCGARPFSVVWAHSQWSWRISKIVGGLFSRGWNVAVPTVEGLGMKATGVG